MALYKGDQLIANVSGNKAVAVYDSLPIGSIIASSLTHDSKNFLICDGRYLSPDDYPDLFNEIGYTFGRDTTDNFAIPNLSDGRIPVSISETDSDFTQGITGGEKTHVLTVNEMPSHNHAWLGVNNGTTTTSAIGDYPFRIFQDVRSNWNGTRSSMQETGNNQPHNNLQPYLATGNFIIKVSKDKLSLLDEFEIKDIVKLVIDSYGPQGGSGGHIIEDNTQQFEQKDKLRFVGATVRNTDDATEVITPSYEQFDINIPQIKQLASDRLPISSIIPYGGPVNTITDGYLPCLGQAVSRSLYHELFNIIGTTYGAGDGETTFNLPNYGGKVPVGLQEDDDLFNELGKILGEKNHKMTISELVEHTHTITSYYDDANYNTGNIPSNTSKPAIPTDTTQTTTTRNHTVTNNTGNSEPFNIVQPSIVSNYIIKVKETAVLTAGLSSTLESDDTDKAPSVHAVNEAIKNFSSAGHAIINENNEELPQENKLKFIGAEVSDDSENGATVITTPSFSKSDEQISNLLPIAGDMTPIGTILPFGGPQEKIETGYLACDGQAVSRTLYKDLFNVIGTTWGVGDGETTFNLPDLRNNTLVGLNLDDDTFNALGKILGEKKHKLINSELPRLSGTLPHNANDEGLVTGVFGHGSTSGNHGEGSWNPNVSVKTVHTFNIGGDASHNNIQPSAVVNYIIKALKKTVAAAIAVDNLNNPDDKTVPTTKAVSDALSGGGSGGHTILNGNTIQQPQRSNLQFDNLIVNDDANSNTTHVSIPSFQDSNIIPVGSIIDFGAPAESIQKGWLPCLGQAVSRETYKTLFDVIGTTYGAGNGSTTFNLPNYGGRVSAGIDTSDDTFNELGKLVGEKTHKLTTSEMPKHRHKLESEVALIQTGGDFNYDGSYARSRGIPYTSYAGNNQPHNNIQPTIIVNKIIKYEEFTLLAGDSLPAGTIVEIEDDAEVPTNWGILEDKPSRILVFSGSGESDSVLTLTKTFEEIGTFRTMWIRIYYSSNNIHCMVPLPLEHLTSKVDLTDGLYNQNCEVTYSLSGAVKYLNVIPSLCFKNSNTVKFNFTAGVIERIYIEY